VERDREYSVSRIPEPLVSYEYVLLTQVSHCAKTSYAEYPLCVDNLISLLPLELQERVIAEYTRVVRRVLSYIRELNLECCRETLESAGVCYCEGYEEKRALRALLDLVEERGDRELLVYRHILPTLISSIVSAHPEKPPVGVWKLKFTIATRLLLESGVIGPKTGALFIGRVED
jgi:hypothetical protein